MLLNVYHRNLATVKISKVRAVIWSSDMSHVALYSKHGTSLFTFLFFPFIMSNENLFDYAQRCSYMQV